MQARNPFDDGPPDRCRSHWRRPGGKSALPAVPDGEASRQARYPRPAAFDVEGLLRPLLSPGYSGERYLPGLQRQPFAQVEAPARR